MSEDKSFPSLVSGVIKSPRRTFNLIGKEDFKKSFFIVSVTAVLSALAQFNYGMKTQIAGFVPPGGNFVLTNPETFKRNIVTIISLFNGLEVVIDWLILSIIVYSISRIISPYKDFKRLTALLGFSQIPLLFQQILRVIDSYIVSEDLLSVYTGSIGSSLTRGLIDIIIKKFTIFGVWAFVLTVLAISNGFESPLKKAVPVVITAYFLYIIFRLLLPL